MSKFMSGDFFCAKVVSGWLFFTIRTWSNFTLIMQRPPPFFSATGWLEDALAARPSPHKTL
jgi:hypothetical protein